MSLYLPLRPAFAILSKGKIKFPRATDVIYGKGILPEVIMDLSTAPRILMSMHHLAALGAAGLFLIESALLGLALVGRSKTGSARS